MKKVLVWMLALAMVLTALAGCAKTSVDNNAGKTPTAESTPAGDEATPEATAKGDTGDSSILNLDSLYPITKEPTDLSLVVLRSSMGNDADKIWWWKYVQKKTNLKLDIKQIDDTAWAERKQLMFTSDELPDVFYLCSFTNSEIMKYGTNEGSFVALDDLVNQYAPLVKEVLGKYPNIKAGITCPDGKYYTLPTIILNEPFSNVRAFINQSWLDSLGLATPKTLDDFYKVLTAFKNQDPNGNKQADEIPWGGSWKEGYSERAVVLSALGYVTTGSDLALRDNKAVFIPLQADYKDYLAYMKKLFTEGLMDKDFFSQPQTQYSAKAAQGLVGFALDGAPFLIEPENDGYKKYQALTPLVDQAGDTPVWTTGQRFETSKFMITSACKTPEVAIRWANAHFDPQESWKYWFGAKYNSEDDIDSMGWEYNETEGAFHPKLKAGIEGINNEWEYVNKFIFPYGTNPVGYHCDSSAEIVLGKLIMPDTEKQWRDSTIKNVKPYFVEQFPSLFLTEEQQNRVNEILTPINDYVTTMEAKFITGAEPIENFDQFQVQLKKLGAEEYLKIMSDAYEVYKTNASK